MRHFVRRQNGRLSVTAAASSVEERIARVAEQHAPEDRSYGQTYWHAEESTVYWIYADGSSAQEVDAAFDAFMGIDGVSDVEVCGECALPPGDGWALLWPEPNPDPKLEAAVQLARSPLPDLPRETLSTDTIEAMERLAASGELSQESLRIAVRALAQAHQVTGEKILEALFASARRGRSDARRALDVMSGND